MTLSVNQDQVNWTIYLLTGREVEEEVSLDERFGVLVQEGDVLV